MGEQNTIIGHRIKTIRKARKRHQKQMASKLGVDVRTYQKYEYGEVDITTERLKQIAEILDVPASYLLGQEVYTDDLTRALYGLVCVVSELENAITEIDTEYNRPMETA